MNAPTVQYLFYLPRFVRTQSIRQRPPATATQNNRFRRIIRVMVSRSPEARSLIDKLLPDHDFSAAYEIHIDAPASVVYQCLLRSDFSELWLVRLLMTVRTGKRLPRNRVPSDLRQRLQGTGFVILAEVPNEELAIGVAGRFWRPDGDCCTDLTPEDFAEFSRPGYAKAVWNFRLRDDTRGGSVLSTETRIKCFGSAALWKFRIYWGLIGPFSGLIRKAVLKHVKAKAESTLLPGDHSWTR
jgi:hypothetical protein